MKYINPKYSLFDSCNFTWLADTDNGGGFTGGDGKISIPAENTKLYVSFELYTTGTSSSNCWPLQIYFSDGAYNSISASTVQIQLDAGNNVLYLKTNNAERLHIPFVTKKWHKIYISIDSVAGTIDLYLDGDKVGTYDGYVKTGVRAINAKIRLIRVNSSLYTKMKNIIISDHFFPLNEEIIVVPATISAGDRNLSDGYYSTDEENSALTVVPDTSVLDGYKVTACNIGMGTTMLGDNIKHLKLESGDFSVTQEIPATGFGMYIEGSTDIGNITITSQK